MLKDWVTGKHKWIIFISLIFILGLLYYKFVYLRAFRIPDQPPQGLVLSDFQFLKKGITFKKIVKTVGMPSERLGGAGQSLIYYLRDGNKLTLNLDMVNFKLQEVILTKPDNTEEILIKW